MVKKKEENRYLGETKLISKWEQFLRDFHSLYSNLISSNGFLDVDEQLGKELKKLKMIRPINTHYELTEKGKQAFKEAFKRVGRSK